MRKVLCFSALFFALLVFAASVAAQSITLRGSVKSSSGETVPAVSVTVKGGAQGTYTDANGDFRIPVPSLPVTLVFTSVGFESQEQNVSSAATYVSVSLIPATTLGQEVVVSATRTPQRILESPVSIERISAGMVRNAAVPNYYDGVANLKGVDLTTSSQTFRTVSTRGFNGSGNLRLNQLVDGIDNQAPALNFAVGSIVGPTELDVDNLELLQGASSALYGSGGTNGTLLINSKNPFKYQGLSFNIKQGINHVDGRQRTPAPYYDWAVRWAKTLGQRWAFKVTGQLVQVQDWQASDTRNLNRQNVFSSLKSGNRQTDPNYDGVNVFGDEASTSMSSLAQAVIAQGTSGFVQAALGLQAPPTTAQIQAFSSTPAGQAALNNFLTTNANVRPFYLGTQANIFTGQFVSRTGYDEKNIVDYNAYNVKLNGALHYKINSTTEASLSAYYGIGTTVYTGADRYALRNFKIGQYKAEVKGTNWFLRGYTTQENSGDSYTATTAALYVNRMWKPNATWFQQYVGTYAGARLAGQTDVAAHKNARDAADVGRLLPGTDAFNTLLNNAKSISIKDTGSKFADRSALYQVEGQYNLSQFTKDVVDVLIGGNFRVYHLNSDNTIFYEPDGPINIKEGGAYIQLQKRALNDVLQLTGSIRYDKNENFKGRFTPRVTALVKVAANNNIRLSYQTAYRFPSTQDQYINLLTGGSNQLVGGLPIIGQYYNFANNPAYTSESIVSYRNSISTGTPNPTLLKQEQFRTISPERAVSYELGYRGLLTKQLLIDAYGYYSQYKDFIGRTAAGRGQSNVPANAPIDLASPFTTLNFSFVTNTTANVNAIGWGVSLNYQTRSGFELSGNVSGDQLNNVPDNVTTFFNTPKLRGNIGVGKSNLGKGFGFNAQWRWQDKIYWEGTFGTGPVPSFSTVDAQITYRLPLSKSSFKLGGSNILNHYYYSAFGNPQVGGIYYISYGFNL